MSVDATVRCRTCGGATAGYKCDLCGAESPVHVESHRCGGAHCMPRCAGCYEAEVLCDCGQAMAGDAAAPARRREAAGRVEEALGRALIGALAVGDFEAVRRILHPDLHLRGLTPGKFNEAKGENAIEQAIDIFRLWFFEDEDRLESVAWCDVRPVGEDGRHKLSFGLRGKSPTMCDHYAARDRARALADDTDWIVEQEAYYQVRDGKIAWLIMLCGGYHPADEVMSHRTSD